jgi:arsenite oxidase large subunit
MANRFLDFDWRTDEDVFIHARYSFKGDGTDGIEGYAGVTYDLLRKLGNNGIQTPVRIVAGTPVGRVRMHEDGRFGTPSGKARFIAAPLPWPGYGGAFARQRSRFRFWVNNGRSNHIWQTSYHHRRIPFYSDRFPIPYVEVNPVDAKSLSIASGDLVELRNDVGTVQAMAYVSDAVKKGHLFMLFGQPRGAAGDLVSDHVDPATTIPYYKGVWADLRRVGPMPENLRSVSLAPMNVAD